MGLGLLTRWRIYQAAGSANELMRLKIREAENPFLPSNTYLQSQLERANARITDLEAKLKEKGIVS